MVNDNMRTFAQVLNGKVHWVFKSEDTPTFSNEIHILEITNNPEVQEGWFYNEENGKITETQVEIPKTIEEATELEQILFETQYQTMLLEMGGGM